MSVSQSIESVEILVFKLDDDGTFEALGEISQYKSFVWRDAYRGYTTFELWAPVNDHNASLLTIGNVVWCRSRNAAFIEIIETTTDTTGAMMFDIKGRTLECLLENRIVWGTVNYNNKFVSEIAYDVVNRSCINASNSNRNIPYLENASDSHLGGKLSVQKTGGTVYKFVNQICDDAGLGFRIDFDPYDKKLVFEVYKGKDRTSAQHINEIVEYTSDLEDLLKTEYYANCEDDRNVAWVQGEGEGADRKSVISGDNTSIGFARKELYVDAKDLQSESGDEHLTPEQYNNVLTQRGIEKLAEHSLVEEFDAEIRVFGEVQYKYGEDYELGDIVTMVDKRIGVTVSAAVTEVEETYSEKYTLELTFGYGLPSLSDKVDTRLSTTKGVI